jgi:hypothetical protein
VGTTTGPCPRCGGIGRVPDGLYEFIGDTLDVVSGWAPKLRQQFASELQAAKDQADPQRAALAAFQKRPELRAVAQRLLVPRTAGDFWAFIATVLAAIALLGGRGGDTTNVNVQTVIQGLPDPGIRPRTPLEVESTQSVPASSARKDDPQHHTISVDVNVETGEYLFYVHGLEATDPDWGLAIGDCLHNARTALDYLMVRLVALATGESPRDIETLSFPIENDPAKLASSFRRLRDEHPNLSGYFARIEELQPFNTGNPSIWGTGPASPRTYFHGLPGALQRLSQLDIIDKHRIVHAAWVGTAPFRASVQAPADFSRSLGGSQNHGPLEDGAQIGNWSFETPLPYEWRPSEMEMKRYFPLQVAIGEPTVAAGVLEILPFCIWAVEAVLTIFQPVFERGKPPLPVTAIPNFS